MKKRILALILLLAILLPVSVQAIDMRAHKISPSFSISGTTATCSVVVRADSSDDDIILEVEIQEDGFLFRHWTTTGSDYLVFNKTATVKKGKTYTMYVDVTINGKHYSTIPITETC